jgi:hypothetical protein
MTVMKKRVLVATVSMALIVGLAGIVNAETVGSTGTQSSNVSTHMNPQNVTSMSPMQRTNAQTGQTQEDQAAQNQSSPSDQTSNHINMPPMSSNGSTTNSGLNMPLNHQTQTMPMSTPMNGQMGNPQSMQGMRGTSSSQTNSSSMVQPSSPNSSGNTMGSMGRMGR